MGFRFSVLVLAVAAASCAGLESWDGFSGGTVAHGDGGPPPPAPPGTPPPTPPAPIAFVQSNATTIGANTTAKVLAPSITATFDGAQAKGNLIVAAIGWYDVTASVASVTDTSGNHYLLAVGPTQINVTANTLTHAIYYATDIAPAAPAANKVTVSFSPQADSPDLRILEYSGLPSASVEAKTSGSGESVDASSGPLTTNIPRTLLVSAAVTGGNSISTVFPFQLRVTSPGSLFAADLVVADAGTYEAHGIVDPDTGENDKTWVLQLAAFR